MIHEFLKNKTVKEKANIKGIEIAKISIVLKTKRKDYDIEITDIKAIEGGVEMFVRAWNSKGQIGFGQDGSVEIERFRFFNPPILVDDSLGTIVRTWIDVISGEIKTRTLREDPKEALLQSLEHTISTIDKGGERIVKGKIGNTTTTFYPSMDGQVARDYNASWIDTRDAASGDLADTGATTIFVRAFKDGTTQTRYGVVRVFILFDTASLPDGDTIDSATLDLYGEFLQDVQNQVLVGVTPASDTALVIADYTALTVNSPTEYATRKSTGDYSTTAYVSWALNATGLSNISKTGITRLGIRMASDVDNSAPPNNTYYGNSYWSVDEAGTTRDPQLVVVHSAASAGPANLKSYNTNVKANIKSIDTNVLANIKSLNTNV